VDLKEQEYVLAIARHGDLKDASEEVGITPPGLSTFISTLERRLGTPLFHRVGKRFIPTDAGKSYIFYAKRMYAYKRDFDAKLSDFKNAFTGQLSIGLQVIRANVVFPPTMKIFSEKYPNVDVNIFEGNNDELFEKLVSGDLDFIVINKKIRNTSLEYRDIYKDRLVCILSHENKAAQMGQDIEGGKLKYLDLKLLDDETFIMPSPVLATRRYVDKAIAYSGVTPGRTLTLENLGTIAQLAAEGVGAGFSLYRFTRFFEYPKPFSTFLVGDLNVYPVYYIVKRKDRYIPRYVSFFMDKLVEMSSASPENV
jgi:DNA-binding transcriptional LysR family regulator